MIVRVLYGRYFRRDQEAVVRVSIENLMAQLVVMVSFFDLVYDVMWLGWGLVIPKVLEPTADEPTTARREELEDYRRFFFVFTQLLMYASHLTLAAHLYAWVVRRSSPAKLSQRFLLRISLVVVAIFIVALCLGFGVAPHQRNQARQCSAQSVAACYGYAMMILAPGTVRVAASSKGVNRPTAF